MFRKLSISGPQNEDHVLCLDESLDVNGNLYVVHYDLNDVDAKTARAEIARLIDDCTSAGLRSAVRVGAGRSLVIILEAPKNILGNAIHRSRIKDWLYGIIDDRPQGSYDEVVDGRTETESLRSMYHLVTWRKELGGAGITAEHGQWKNVKSVFGLHDKAANKKLLKSFSRKATLDRKDLDHIRDIYGEKTAFYFCFLQTYMIALLFPAITGVLAWWFLHRISMTYAITTTVWCIIFLEYWRLEEISLSHRWNVSGVGSLKVDRKEYVWEKEVCDSITGEKQHHFPKYKQVLRQLLSIPFTIFALLVLGSITTGIFGIEVFISHIYTGAYKDWLEYLPTVFLALCLPYISDWLEEIAEQLTVYENHRTQDRHEMAHTQKVFMLTSITKYLPIFLTAFVYIPFGDEIIDFARVRVNAPSSWTKLFVKDVHVDASRLRSEVIALTITEQLSGFAEEMFVPLIKLRAKKWYATWKGINRFDYSKRQGTHESLAEHQLLQQIRDESQREAYNVQEDIQEMVTQFGYLALFSPVWPLVPIGFLINNWIELRSDLLKISIEARRPDPVRTDGLGSWIDSLNFLTWLGSIVTAAIVHLYHDVDKIDHFKTWWTLPITIFVAEHIYLSTKYVVRLALEQLGSAELRQKKLYEYAQRKKAFEEYKSTDSSGVNRVERGTSDALSNETAERMDEIGAMIDFVKKDSYSVSKTKRA